MDQRPKIPSTCGEKQDTEPDPHQSEKLDPDVRSRIRIRIRTKMKAGSTTQVVIDTVPFWQTCCRHSESFDGVVSDHPEAAGRYRHRRRC
jgi:hypothetical protein